MKRNRIMTKKDYIAIAAALKQTLRYCETDYQRRGVQRASLTLADMLAADNPLFDRARFLDACKGE
jgi:hypothetical protein